jgi:pimeloyl-ACP methyl ester carboxylesterase
VRWDRIVVVGWSEGGSQAAWLAREILFDGVLLIGAPKDVGGEIDGQPVLPPAPWVDDARVTPACRHWGFYHTQEIDPNPQTDVLLVSWDAMGMMPLGQQGVDVDVVPTPYDDSQVLRTNKSDFNEGFGCTYHQAMAMDQCMHQDLAVPYNWLFCNAGVPTPECP